jgi:alpha-L-rhamnosidase
MRRIAFILAPLFLAHTAMSMTPTHLRTEYLDNPIGLGETSPRLSWWVESGRKGDVQTAYQIVAATSEAGLNTPDLWDSGVVKSDETTQIAYGGKPLGSRLQVYWKVKVWDSEGNESVSKPAKWEMGLLDPADWKAVWVGIPDPDTSKMTPAAHVRKEFSLHGGIRKARIYASAHGLYKLFLDGQRIGNDVFAPGWTDYKKRIQYQVFDVTKSLKPGTHALGAVLGDGWFCGHVGFGPWRHYGKQPRALIQLEVEYNDGSTDVISTDDSWKAANGPILTSDFMKGEEYDARKELTGWDKPGYQGPGWVPISTEPLGTAALVASDSEQVSQWHEFKPKKITEPEQGMYVVDLGQNMVGFARLKVHGPPGVKVQLRFAEMLNPNGTVYTENLRSATSTDTYTLKGGGEEIFEPSFTFHGFRYVEVTGYPGKLPEDAITGIVVGSGTPDVMKFETSNKMVNQLQHNIYWGQRGNYLSVPTDCPQRDERLGWMGDAEVFARTAAYNCEVAPFLTKWLQDVRDAQHADGAFTDVVPDVLNQPGAPAWGDAGVIVPWRVYEAYGDTRILEKQYDAMKAWVEYIHEVNPDLLWTNRRNNDYGDWVSVNSSTPKEVLATAYWANSTHILSRAAAVLGKTEDANHYREMFEGIRAAFQKAFVGDDVRIKGDTQTCYLMALGFDLLPEDKRATAAKYLAEDVRQHGTHLSTGFLGVSFICPILTKFGYNDVAYQLLLNDTYPSWGYSIKQGATTIWERWDGYTTEKGFQDPGMNSFNHYSFGSIGEWMYSVVGGVAQTPDSSGFKHLVIHPQVGGNLTWAKTAYDTPHGRVECSWKKSGGKLTVDVTVPTNTVADVVLDGEVTPADLEGVTLVSPSTYRVGGGKYSFAVDLKG